MRLASEDLIQWRGKTRSNRPSLSIRVSDQVALGAAYVHSIAARGGGMTNSLRALGAELPEVAVLPSSRLRGGKKEERLIPKTRVELKTHIKSL